MCRVRLLASYFEQASHLGDVQVQCISLCAVLMLFVPPRVLQLRLQPFQLFHRSGYRCRCWQGSARAHQSFVGIGHDLPRARIRHWPWVKCFRFRSSWWRVQPLQPKCPRAAAVRAAAVRGGWLCTAAAAAVAPCAVATTPRQQPLRPYHLHMSACSADPACGPAHTALPSA